MTKKHYEATAATIKRHLTYGSGEVEHVLMLVARDLADDFKRDNVRFDRARFLTACGFGPAEQRQMA